MVPGCVACRAASTADVGSVAISVLSGVTVRPSRLPPASTTSVSGGTAAAMAAASGRPLRELPVADVQSALRRRGVRLDPALVAEAQA